MKRTLVVAVLVALAAPLFAATSFDVSGRIQQVRRHYLSPTVFPDDTPSGIVQDGCVVTVYGVEVLIPGADGGSFGFDCQSFYRVGRRIHMVGKIEPFWCELDVCQNRPGLVSQWVEWL